MTAAEGGRVEWAPTVPAEGDQPTTQPRPSTVGHLHALTHALPDGAGIVISQAPPFARGCDVLVTRDAVDAGAEACSRLTRLGRSAYCSVTATDEDAFQGIVARSSGARGGDADARWLIAMWADIDIAGPGHANSQGLPTSVAEAERIYADLPTPTMVVATGGGLHAWWLLAEPVAIEQRRKDVEDFVGSWQTMLGAHANRYGHRVDRTTDLARVLRVCGTLNHKYGSRVTLHSVGTWPPGLIEGKGWTPGPLHSADELAALCAKHEPKPQRTEAKVRRAPAAPQSERPRSEGLNILDAVHAAPWSDIWPRDWEFVGTEIIAGSEVELWRRPGAASDHSVKCWPGSCKVWSDAIPGLPNEGYTKAEVLAWREGCDLPTLARRLIEAGRSLL